MKGQKESLVFIKIKKEFMYLVQGFLERKHEPF